MSTRHAWSRGQRVILDMGIAGGHWIGVTSLLPGDLFGEPGEKHEAHHADGTVTVGVDLRMPDGRILVTFGKNRREGVSIGFDVDDEHLKPAPDDLSEVVAGDQARRAEHAKTIDLDHPQWPAGFFGEEGERAT